MQFWLARGLGFALNHIETAFDYFFGLKGWPHEYKEFDTQALLRVAYKDRIEVLARGVQGGIFSPDEARNSEDLPRTPYGDEPRVQQQVVPLSAWAKALPATPRPDAPVQHRRCLLRMRRQVRRLTKGKPAKARACLPSSTGRSMTLEERLNELVQDLAAVREERDLTREAVEELKSRFALRISTAFHRAQRAFGTAQGWRAGSARTARKVSCSRALEGRRSLRQRACLLRWLDLVCRRHGRAAAHQIGRWWQWPARMASTASPAKRAANIPRANATRSSTAFFNGSEWIARVTILSLGEG